MTDSKQNAESEDAIPKTASVRPEERRELFDHEDFDSLKMDADHKAFMSLPEEMKEVIDQADHELDGWKPADRYFELNQRRISHDKRDYVRSDMTGVAGCDFSQVGFSEEELKEAIKEWNGRQLTVELRMAGIREEGDQ